MELIRVFWRSAYQQVTLVINPVDKAGVTFTRPAVTFPVKEITPLAGTNVW